MPDYSPAAVKRFRDWLRKEYQGDEKLLQNSWSKAEVTFSNAQPPSGAERKTSELFFFRHPQKARAVIDYRRFLSAVVSDSIIRSCRTIKDACEGKKLAGVFYGYSVLNAIKLPSQGFQALQKIMNAPEVDFFSAPTDYGERRGGGTGCFINAYTASLRLHNKLYWDEVDTRTHLRPLLDGIRTANKEETISVHRRAAGYSLTKGTGLWWFLLTGNATFHQNEVMEDIKKLKSAWDSTLGADRATRSEVAVFVDEESMFYSNKKPEFQDALLWETYSDLHRTGAPFDLYHLSDLGNPALPNYRLYIFLNAFKLSQEQKELISQRFKKEGKYLAWVYAPGFIDDKGFNDESMKAVVGINIRHEAAEKELGLVITDKSHPITSMAGKEKANSYTLGPIFHVDDPTATILGTVDGKPGLAVRDFDTWHSAYSAVPLDVQLLKGLYAWAGIHIYCETTDVFFANQSFLLLHSSTSGKKRIVLPEARLVRALVPEEATGRRVREFMINMSADDTRIYLLSEQAR